VKTRVLTITLAAVLALVGVVAVTAYVRQANERAMNGQKPVTVYWAKAPIAAGTSLSAANKAGLLATETEPASSFSTAAVESVTAAKGKVLTGAVPEGQVLLQNMLGSASSVTSSGGFIVPSGDVAVSVDMCVPEDVADYVNPGSDVAVFDTLVLLPSGQQMTPSCSSGHPASSSGVVTNTSLASSVLVLPSVEVLAVGQNPGSQSTSGSSGTATDPASSSSGDVLVTFAVNQNEAQQLILLQEIGIPYLALLGQNTAPTLRVNQPVSLFPNQP
jgi:pilus assembly protein CpaB